MIINNNIPALNTYRQLGINQNSMQKSMEKLSSGLRINKAGDDAAGLAISEKMRGQIRGLDQASRNASDGISLIQTAEGGLQETHNILQRMRELAVQSSNDTNNDTDRGEIQKEIDQLKSEIDRIANNTEFNTKKLLNGDVGQTSDFNSNAADVDAVRINDPNLSGTTTVTFDDLQSSVKNVQAGAGFTGTDITISNTAAQDAAGMKAGKYSIEFSGAAGDASATLKDANGNTLSSVSGVDTASGSFDFQLDDSNNSLVVAGGNYNGSGGTLEFDLEITADLTVEYGDGSTESFTGVTANDNSTVAAGGLEIDLKTDAVGNVAASNDTFELEISNNGLKFHIGANEDQNTTLSINQMDTEALSVDEIDVQTQSGADSAITAINDAIENVSAERSKLGANQNRLEHTISNLDNSSENLSAAESRIRDVDMAKEMMEMTRANILSQASQSMLAQANNSPQSVLQLLG